MQACKGCVDDGVPKAVIVCVQGALTKHAEPDDGAPKAVIVCVQGALCGDAQQHWGLCEC
eukprot:1157395-Pelagomonas_calceolata.AAC.2